MDMQVVILSNLFKFHQQGPGCVMVHPSSETGGLGRAMLWECIAMETRQPIESQLRTKLQSQLRQQ